ncbi:hypothetical protein MtrunA17_Chr8g0381761 [Medicago truncatula]|uniref:Transmembrane protein n=1 Tax=Medicago truncatula TaxID=3880 RepID=A0A396GP50_MEDTR|nr:hypothetical protein MtrunA17_Chr8g0381761 [Medicago truncatula]
MRSRKYWGIDLNEKPLFLVCRILFLFCLYYFTFTFFLLQIMQRFDVT